MGVYDSHSILCSCVFAGNETDSVEEQTMKNTLKHETNRKKNGVFVHLVQQMIKMMSKKEDSKTMNVIEMKNHKELL